MKKTYISPEIVVVRLGMARPLATSTFGVSSSSTDALNSEDILVKENNITDINIWDDEW